MKPRLEVGLVSPWIALASGPPAQKTDGEAMGRTAPSGSARTVRLTALAALLLGAVGVHTRGMAHDFLGRFIQHHVVVKVGSSHIDVQVELTFFEDWSQRERTRMDRNGDGRVAAEERRGYVSEFRERWEQGLQLEVDGEGIELVPLFEPEVTLEDAITSTVGRHKLQLAWFAATPCGLKAGSRMVVRDRLWRAAPALSTVSAQGKDGIRVEFLTPCADVSGNGPAAPELCFEVQCVRGPTADAAIPSVLERETSPQRIAP